MFALRRITVGLDAEPGVPRLTAGCFQALEWARWLATSANGEVTLVHSTAHDEAWDERSGGYTTVSTEPGGAPFEAALEGLRGAGVEARLVFSEESPWLALARQASKDGSDLVLVGKRAAPFLHGPLLGSVSAKLVRRCPCPVWVAKPGASSPPPRVILAATDLSPVGDRVLDAACDLAGRSGAALHVVHTFQLSMSVQMGRDEDPEAFAERTRSERTDRLRAQLEAAGAPAEVSLHVALSSPTHVVLECEKRHSPDLIVMGTISRGGVAGVLLGNTAERLLGRLDTSILTIKPEDFVGPVL